MFIERCGKMAKKNCYYAMITQQAWMFQPTYTQLRVSLRKKTVVNLLHLGSRAFDEIAGEVVQTVSFIYVNTKIEHYLGAINNL